MPLIDFALGGPLQTGPRMVVRPPLYSLALPQPAPRRDISAVARGDEATLVAELAKHAAIGADVLARGQGRARELIEKVRAGRSSGLDALMHEFPLASDEGIALMCLAEALLRVPDRATADRLIRDVLGRGQWEAHFGRGQSIFVGAAAWGLVTSRRVVDQPPRAGRLGQAFNSALERLGEPVIRGAMRTAMRFLGEHFVAGQTIDAALQRSRARETKGYRFSYDMLGEAATTRRDALAYFGAYLNAIHAIGQKAKGRGTVLGPGVSVKLSALHPRYVRTQRERVITELLPRLRTLAVAAKQYGLGLAIDAEESDRIDLSLDLLEMLAADPELAGWQGLGFAVQAYQKRALPIIDHVADLARRNGRRINLRLVKGAYWDAEIKRAQADGMGGYPVFTRKAHTDVSFLACARRMLERTETLYPQFATHNALTLGLVEAMAGGYRNYEFQALHGMGESLYDQFVSAEPGSVSCRIYAPVGTHETLLAYLVRRLLENGANGSFVSRMTDPATPIESLLENPIALAEAQAFSPHPQIPLPINLYPDRRNSRGIDFANELDLAAIERGLAASAAVAWSSEPLLAVAHEPPAGWRPVVSPANGERVVGRSADATEADVEVALAAARSALAYPSGWKVEDRAQVLERAADRLEANMARFVHLVSAEAGRTLQNAMGEVREAADFCRYYAREARRLGELEPLGTVACISPWNFPLSIFVGQVAGALAAGNAVIAKPAEETTLVGAEAVRMFHEVGVPPAVLQYLPGPGETIGARIVADSRVAGVVFTGSTDVARAIARTLAERGDVPLVAETGGQNAMIVDSTALPEQVVADVLASAFDSAGQRCSALRVLCLQEEIADRVLRMLAGAIAELHLGDPVRLATDVGPVIDAPRRAALEAYVATTTTRAEGGGRLRARAELTEECARGSFVPPTVIEIGSLDVLEGEVFGPVLHVLRFPADGVDALVDAINAKGYGLTFGVQSRVEETVERLVARCHAGNAYVNRSMIGAVVGVQPFGGSGLSGTGPKAGGPFYLRRLVRGWLEVEPSGARSPRAVQLLNWAERLADPALADVVRYYAERADLHPDVVLPGPTGERNVWCARPRGRVACLGDASGGAPAWVGQMAAALSAGNEPIVIARSGEQVQVRPRGEDDPHDALLWELVSSAHDAGLAVSTLETSGTEALRSPEPFDAVLVDGDAEHVRTVAQALAKRSGPIVPLVTAVGASWRYPIWRLVGEHVTSVNTTAAGGNASLLAAVA
jgi:RHH-type proline utilization regulon transcriptional repressor/proline dehydrogenase/delta 1-pyrroline-5-carboxylate dehydrogenase